MLTTLNGCSRLGLPKLAADGVNAQVSRKKLPGTVYTRCLLTWLHESNLRKVLPREGAAAHSLYRGLDLLEQRRLPPTAEKRQHLLHRQEHRLQRAGVEILALTTIPTTAAAFVGPLR